jgi:hypothetical protein
MVGVDTGPARSVDKELCDRSLRTLFRFVNAGVKFSPTRPPNGGKAWVFYPVDAVTL